MTYPPAIDMARQLGRHWAAWSALDGMSLAEAGSAQPASIYAGAMPARAERLSPAAAIVPASVAAYEGGSSAAIRAIGLDVFAAAPTSAAAMAVLADLLGVLFAAGRPFAWPATATRPSGLIGLPAIGAGQTARVWRVIDLRQTDGPSDLGGRPSDQRGDEGERRAVMSLEVLAAGYTVEGE